MLTLLHRQSLQKLVEENQPAQIHRLMEQFSVADQKQAKMLLARHLADRKICSLGQCLDIYVHLLTTHLNLYFKTFQLANESLCREPDFWLCLHRLAPLGEHLAHERPYYRQQLMTTWLSQVNPAVPVDQLFQLFQVSETRSQLTYLLRSDSLYGWYLFIHKAHQGDCDAGFLCKCCNYLLSAEKSCQPSHVRQDVVQFMVLFFNNLPVNYPFYRRLEITQIAYAESSYEAFCKVIIPAKRFDIL